MKKIFLIIAYSLLLTAITTAQTSRFQRNFTTTAGTPLTGFSNYIFLVPQANTYPTGALALTEDGTRPGVYYRINVADGEYKIYVDTDKGGANPPILFLENYWVGEKRLSTIADHFDAGDSYRLKGTGIKDAAITNNKLGTDAVTELKIMDNAVTANKINDASVTNTKIMDLSVNSAKLDWSAVTSGKILDANVTLPKLSQTVLDYINGAGGGTIENFPDDITLGATGSSTIELKRNQTRQTNFGGVIPLKLNADSSVRLGGTYGAVSVGILKERNNANYTSMAVIPLDTSLTATWRVNHIFLDWDVNHNGKELAYEIAYNSEQKHNRPYMAFAMEPEYEIPSGGYGWNVYEWWFRFTYPGDYSAGYYTNQPFGVNQRIPYSGNVDSITSSVTFMTDELWMGSPKHAGYMLDFQFKQPGVSSLSIADSFYIINKINNVPWLFQSIPGSGGTVNLMYLDSTSSIVLYDDNGEWYSTKIKLGATLNGLTDSASVAIGSYTKATNGFRVVSNYSDGGIYYSSATRMFGIVGSLASADPDDWYALSPTDQYNSWKTNLYVSGSLGIGTKTMDYAGGDVSFIALANTPTVPTTVAGQLGIYSESGVLKVKNPSGTIYSLTGSANFDNVSTTAITGKVTAGFYNTSHVVTINTSSPVDMSTGTYHMAYVADISTGGSCLVIYQNGQTPTIVSQIGTTFVLTSPGASEIQLANGSTSVTALGGSGKNGTQLSVIIFRAQE